MRGEFMAAAAFDGSPIGSARGATIARGVIP